jgi:hypothetical protein
VKIGVLDEYSRNARLKPAFLVLLPVAIVLASFKQNYSLLLGGISATTVSGLTFLLAQLGRDRGKLKEPSLFVRWGGKPSVVKLRHRDGTVGSRTLGRYHAAGASALGEPFPTKEQEMLNPTEADALYQAYCDLLLEKTRNKEAFPLVFAELTNYGFRRNLWGMKAIGVFLAAICFLVEGVRIAVTYHLTSTLNKTLIPFVVIEGIVVLSWVVLITPTWVRLAADAYARSLLASCECVVWGP